MRIRKLKIKNLASIEDAELDFTSGVLAQQSLFLITGPTGSGKTTILDAITLALFDTTARFTQATMEDLDDESGACVGMKTNDCRRLVRRGADFCSVELVFEGNDGQEYKAQWSVKKKRTGPLGNAERTIETPTQIISGKKQVEAFIKEVTNIDFNQYCKTTMLAQGDFTKFLKSKGEEKSLILEKILSADIFTKIGMKISDKSRECKNKCEEKRNLIENLPVASDEEVENIRRSVTELRERTASLNMESKAVRSKKDWLSRYLENKDKLVKVTDELQKAEKAVSSPDNARRRSDIALWDKTERLRSLISALQIDQETLSAEKKKLSGFVMAFNSNVALLNARRKSISNENVKLSKICDDLSKLSSSLGGNVPKDKYDAQEEKSRLENVLQDISTADNELNKLSLISNDLKVKEGIVAEINVKIEQLQDETSKALALKDEAEKRKRIADERLDEINKKCDYATEVIKMVHVGDTCPVCGGKIEHLGAIDEFEAVKAPFRQEQSDAAKAANDAAKHYSESKLDLENQQKTQALELSAQESVKQQYRKASNEVVSHLQKVGENGYDGSDAINIQAVSSSLAKRQKEGRERLDALSEFCKLLDIKERLETSISHEQEKFNSAEVLYAKVLKDIPDWKGNKIEDIDDVQSVNVSNNWTAFTNNLTQWMTTVKNLRSAISSKEEEIKNERLKIDVELDVVKALAGTYSQAKIAIERRFLEELDTAVVSSKRSVTDLENALKSLEIVKPDLAPSDTIESLSHLEVDINKILDDTNRNIGSYENKLKTDVENRKRRGKEEEALKKLEEENEKWGALSFISDSKGKNFRTIALNFIFDELLNYSNKHLRDLTDNRFTLVRNGTLNMNISIRDAYHCDAIQTPANLSGGESFMVSLALSLGLASMSGAGSCDSDILFIDEGFGTLDDECLEKVTTLLEKLRDSGGKRVGIISHVDILKEKIQAQVRVEPVDPSRSRVTVVG